MKARLLKWNEEQKQNETTFHSLDDFRKRTLEIHQEKIQLERINQFLEKIPVRFRNKSFDDYVVKYSEQNRTKLICQRFVDTFSERLNQGNNAMFLGMPGTGKTLLSLIMYRSLAQAGYSVHYESSLSFIKAFQEKLYKSQASYQSLIDYYKNIQFLILDEITESLNKDGIPSDYEKKLLFNIINARYEQKSGCTFVISNRDKQALTHRLGQPIVDRLSEQGMTLSFNWPSFRQNEE